MSHITNNITRSFALTQKLNKKYATRIRLGNGVTPSMVKDAALVVMKSRGANYSDMSAEDMAAAVNCLTSCEACALN